MATTTQKNYQILQRLAADSYLLLHPETNAANVLAAVEGIEGSTVQEILEKLVEILGTKADASSIPTKVSDLTNDGDGTEGSQFATVKQVEEALANATGGESASDVKTALDNHKADKNNPHGVTCEQIGAATSVALGEESSARSEADEALSGRIATIEGYDIPNKYATKSEVEGAIAGVHSHDNKAVLDGITVEKVAAWDASEQNAKDYADGAVAAEAAIARAAEQANADAIAAEKARLDAFLADADVTEKAVDTLKEIQEYITSDGAAADKMVEDIAAAKAQADKGVADAATAQAAADKAQGEVDALEGVVGAMYTNGEIDELVGTVDGKVDDLAEVVEGKADASALVEYAKTADVNASLEGKADKSVVEGLATTVAGKADASALDAYATNEAVNGKVTEINNAIGLKADQTALDAVVTKNGEQDTAIAGVKSTADTAAADIAKIVDGTTTVAKATSAASATTADALSPLAGLEAGTYCAVTVDNTGRVTGGGHMIEVAGSTETVASEKLAIGGLFFKMK